MVFSSLIFLFAYLCVTLTLYYILPRAWRNVVLFIVSLAFYGWGEPLYILVMLFSICTAYGFGFLIARDRIRNRKRALMWLTFSVCINLAALVFFKYTNFFIENLNYLPFINGAIKEISNLTLPIGISFYTFQIISYSVDVYRGDTEVQKNFISFGTYVTLFPQLIAGPIVRYRDVNAQLSGRHENIVQFSSGVERFCIGLGKKVLLGDGMAAMYEYYKSAAQFENTVLGAWLIVIGFTLHIYFDFSGYSDMAIGLGRMFGFEFLENFNYPYISKSITEFWRRWHISLSTWFREYVYIPLGGNRRGHVRQYLNIAIVWFLTGFWHGASWNYILWGVYFCVILIIEKAFLLRLLERLPSFISHIYALLLIGFGWIIFAFKDLAVGASVFGALFGIGVHGLYSGIGAYEALRFLPLLVICEIGATPYPTRIFGRIREKFPRTGYAVPVLVGLVLIFSVSYLVDSTFSPFLYFEF